MGKLSDANRDEESELDPEALATRAFSRCQNWPDSRDGILGLAQALRKASDRFNVPMQRIIEECVEVSTFCPTDTDLNNIARSLRPAPPDPANRKCPFSLCDGSGWREACYLHTRYPGDENHTAWVEKSLISREVYDDLATKVDYVKQLVYEARYRCRCHPPRDPEEIGRRKTRPRKADLTRPDGA